MTDKPFKLYTDLANNCFIVGDDVKFGMFDKLDRQQVIRVIDYLNKLAEEKEIYVGEAKHQQGQKQRLSNYLR